MRVTAPIVPALLRAPPFPDADGSISFAWRHHEAARIDHAEVFARIRAVRIGSDFWANPCVSALPGRTVLRPRLIAELPDLLASLSMDERPSALWISGHSAMSRALRRLVRKGGCWRANVDPWSALDGARCLLAHGDDDWLAVARIMNVPVQVLSAGRFGAPGDYAVALDSKVAGELAATVYRDPFTGGQTTIEATIELLAEWRRILDANRPIAAAVGMAWWKQDEIRRFLWHPCRPLRIVHRPAHALRLARRAGGAVAIWPSRVSPALLADAGKQKISLVCVEDGFVRSVGLGSGLVPPSSIVVDRRGIHFDPRRASDLETILAETDFTERLLERGRALRSTIVAAGISKYGAGGKDTTPVFPERCKRRLVLVPGQVEDDMSVIAGGGGLRSNLELLRRARALEPDAEIWFRPHPDVDAGHRRGAVSDVEVLTIADRIMREPPMTALLDCIDAVHVLTSLTGFEALLRGCAVTCHGTPFYAGWGLTRDLSFVPHRRGRTLSLDELVAGVLILYPRYLDPVSGLPCPPETLVARMAADQAPNRLGWIAPIRQLQGRLNAMWR